MFLYYTYKCFNSLDTSSTRMDTWNK